MKILKVNWNLRTRKFIANKTYNHRVVFKILFLISAYQNNLKI
jgi:hypothetical protein